MPNRYMLFGSILFLAIAAFARDSVSTTSGPAFSAQAHFSGPPPSLGRSVTGAPYSAEETNERVQTLADGTHITQPMSSTKVYRDSSGRTRTERSLMPGRMVRQRAAQDIPVIVEITDPVEHVRYTLDTVNKVAHKQIMAPREPRTLSRPAPPPAKTVTAAAPEQTAEDRPPPRNSTARSSKACWWKGPATLPSGLSDPKETTGPSPQCTRDGIRRS